MLDWPGLDWPGLDWPVLARAGLFDALPAAGPLRAAKGAVLCCRSDGEEIATVTADGAHDTRL